MTSPPMAPRGVTDLATLVELREAWRRQGLVVVWTNGVFDLLHVGHVRNLEAASRFGDILIVGINADESVRRLKGSERPINRAEERAEVLAALSVVDYVMIFEEDTPAPTLERLQPDVHVKGEDYRPPHGKPIPEAATVEGYGGRIAFVPLVAGRSTSEVVDQLKRNRQSREGR